VLPLEGVPDIVTGICATTDAEVPSQPFRIGCFQGTPTWHYSGIDGCLVVTETPPNSLIWAGSLSLEYGRKVLR
jgi:hypothetical protein